MNKFFKGSICVLALSSLVATSATAQVVDEAKGVGYVSELGNTLTGAVEKISGERLKDYNLTSTEALVGQFAALNGTTIRGSRTTSTATAHILIDGLEQAISTVDVEDIESIEILKDAAATAIYGIRAANGIILITTKRGQLNTKPQVKLKVQNSYLYTASTPESVDGATYNSVIEDLSGYSMANYTADINWADEMLKPLVNEIKASAQITGGTERAKYFLSAMYNQRDSYYNYDDNSFSQFSGYNNISLRSNLEVKINRNTTFYALVSANIGNTKTPEDGDSTLLDYFYTTPNSVYQKYTDYTSSDGTVTQYYGGDMEWQTNPYAELVGKGYDHVNHRYLSAQIKMDHRMDYLTKGLFIKGDVGLYSQATYTNAYTGSYMMAGLMPNGEMATYGTYSGLDWSSESRAQSSWYTYSLNAGYERDFGKHAVSAIVGARLDNYVLTTNAILYNFFNLSGQVAYDYDNRYVAELTTTYGGTNSVSRDNKFIPLPTLGLAWNVSNEAFWNKGGIVNSLKVRGSLGLLSSDELGSASRFMFLDTYYVSGTSHYFGVNAGTSYTTYVENEAPYDGKYEKSLAGNIGIDARLFNSLNVSLDYFNETRYDIFLSYATQISGTWGGTTPYVNHGKVHSQGLEAVINYNKSFSKDVNLNASLVAGFSRNIIKQTYQYDNPYTNIIGQSTSQAYGWVADGLYQLSDFDSDGNLNSGLAVNSFGPVQAGDIKYQDISGADGKPDGVIDNYDRVGLYSNSNPINLGLNLDFKYKRFSLGLMFDSELNSMANLVANYVFTPLDGGYDNISKYAYENAWSYDNQSGTLPRMSTDEVAVNNLNSTMFAMNTNYLRLRTAQVGYSFPIKGASSESDKNIAVYLVGHNLFTLDSLPSNLDATRTGYSFYGSSFTLSVDFTF